MKAKTVDRDSEQRLLAAVHDLGELSATESAERHKVSVSTLQRKFHQWIDEVKIRRGVLINWPALGIWPINIFFSLSSKESKKGLRYLKLHPQFSWLSENLSSKRYEATVLCRDLGHLSQVFDQISAEGEATVLEPIWACEVSWTYWAPRSTSVVPVPREFNLSSGLAEIDLVDMKIIEKLRRTGESLPQIARELGLPLSTLHHRMKRLKESRVIEAVYYFPTWEAFNFSRYQILLSGCQRDPAMRKILKGLCSRHSIVHSLYRCVGSWDFKILCIAKSESMVLEFIEALKLECGSKFTSEFLVKGHKPLAVNSRPIWDAIAELNRMSVRG